jgi:hypothetical protein
MLRMEFYEFPNYMKLRMEGRFVGEFAEHAKTLIGGPQPPSKLIVDLSEVNYVDVVGEEVLLWFKKMGVTFTADSAYSHDVCKRLELLLEGGPPGAHRPRGKTRKEAQGFRPGTDGNPRSIEGETQL